MPETTLLSHQRGILNRSAIHLSRASGHFHLARADNFLNRTRHHRHLNLP